MSASYVVGEFATLVADDGVVLASPDRLAQLAALGGSGLDVDGVVDVLARGDVRDLADFAVVRVVDLEARIMVRGGFTVRIGQVTVDGRDGDTWAEASAPLTAGEAIEVTPTGTPLAGPALPLSAGVVRSGGLTWRPAGEATPEATPVPAPDPVPEPAFEPSDEYTVYRDPARASAPPAAVVPPPVAPATPAAPAAPPAVQVPVGPPPFRPPDAPPPDAGAIDPDHDGRTITPAQLQALRTGQVPAPAPSHASPPAPPIRPLVALALSTGRVVTVRRRVLIGRSPRIQQVGGSANLPALVTVDDPYVSSTHLEVASDGVRVTATDTSTNGTLLARQGRAPVSLGHGVATEVAIGDVLTLSKGLTATVVPAEEA